MTTNRTDKQIQDAAERALFTVKMGNKYDGELEFLRSRNPFHRPKEAAADPAPVVAPVQEPPNPYANLHFDFPDWTMPEWSDEELAKQAAISKALPEDFVHPESGNTKKDFLSFIGRVYQARKNAVAAERREAANATHNHEQFLRDEEERERQRQDEAKSAKFWNRVRFISLSVFALTIYVLGWHPEWIGYVLDKFLTFLGR